MQIYDDGKLQELIKNLNSLYSVFDQWKFIRARKEHEDEFGDKIAEGELYFKREYGIGWDEVCKLSRGSMEKMLYCIFNGNFRLEQLCKELDEQRYKI